MKRIQAELAMRASAELEKVIEEELQKEDPDPKQSKAILKADENSKRDDRRPSDRDNK